MVGGKMGLSMYAQQTIISVSQLWIHQVNEKES